MPTKRVPRWKDKPVFVSVYVERPKRRPTLTTRHYHYHHHDHHHHVHHTIKQEVIHHGDGAGGKGYTTSMRAEPLQYSQRLRQSARTTPPSPPSIPYVPNPNHTSNPQSQAKIVAVPRKPKNAKAPSCFGNCNLPTIFGPLTSFHAKKERRTRTKRSGHASNKIKVAIKILRCKSNRTFSPSCSQHQQSESETVTTNNTLSLFNFLVNFQGKPECEYCCFWERAKVL